MTTITKSHTPRKQRKKGEKNSSSIKLDSLSPGDDLIVEIVANKKKDIRYWYKFEADQLTGKKNVTFRISGDDVRWLSGANPRRLFGEEIPKQAPDHEPKAKVRKGRKSKVVKAKVPADPDWRKRKRGPQIRKVLLFDAGLKMVGHFETLEVAARITNLLPEAIDRLCKSKRPSQDTKLSFRYLYPYLGLNLSNFTHTATEYDELNKRNKPDIIE